ncbi:hypothetical protein LY01_02777 [Nonlabens xylanidelens]|uniref:Uncharacterized protein n=1 Tax=Nonlabens xylanidelens TaxID=191564 RepID=A0A2S6IFS6_9FLAO|nr:hypothetical protein [Nonlabens xylanidelens]PPK93072.1 hypothetical protein LY01_02777 [Nonlabens xylanidelens]
MYGNTLGVITFVLSESGNNYEQLTIFKVVKNSFSLISNNKTFKKSDVEKVDSLVVVYIINGQSSKSFVVKDSIDKSLFEKTLSNSFNMSWIKFSDRIVSSQIDESQYSNLKVLKNKYIKDHHFTVIGDLGITYLAYLNMVKIPDIKGLIIQNFATTFKLDGDNYDLIGLNSLGIVASIFSQNTLNTKMDFRNDLNVLKSFAKRILFKMVPVILIIMILNYFYVNKLNVEITESQYEISLVDDIIGDKRLNEELKKDDVYFFNQLSLSYGIQRAHIINDIIDCHVEGISYVKIIIDPSNVKEESNLSKGKGEIWFETSNTDLIDLWEKSINKKGQFVNVKLTELSTNNKDLSQGYISFGYE